MRRASFAAAAAGSLLAAMSIAPSTPIAEQTTVVRASPAADTRTAPAPAAANEIVKAVRQADPLIWRGGGSPTKHKNRRPGERAHRRWRKRRSSGRARR
ncbi:hypothetical protein C3941_19635 [Kaistia algarum]|nr:hypothetical protein C3941_19635 [Kaistia algarum]